MPISSRPTVLPILLAATVAALMPRVTDACSCTLPDGVLPQDGAAAVPTNTRVWAFLPHPSLAAEIALANPDGTIVDADRSTITVRDWELLVLTPRSPLAPRTRYEIRSPVPSSFTTGDGPANTGPAPLAEAGRRGIVEEDGLFGSSSCRPVYGAVLSLVPDPARVLNVAVFEDTPVPDFSTALAGRVDVAQEWGRDAFSFVEGGCGFGWRGAERGAVARVRIGAFDLTGRFSGWSEPIELAADFDGHPGGCASAPVGVLGLFVLALRRRARR